MRFSRRREQDSGEERNHVDKLLVLVDTSIKSQLISDHTMHTMESPIALINKAPVGEVLESHMAVCGRGETRWGASTQELHASRSREPDGFDNHYPRLCPCVFGDVWVSSSRELSNRIEPKCRNGCSVERWTVAESLSRTARKQIVSGCGHDRALTRTFERELFSEEFCQ